MQKNLHRNIYIITLFVLSVILSFFILQPYIISVMIAIIAAYLLRPIYLCILPWCYKKSSSLASALTICIFITLLLAPSIYLLGVALEEAVQVGTNIRSGVQYYLESSQDFPPIVQQFIQLIQSYDIVWKLEQSIGEIWTVVIWSLWSIGTMTLNALLQVFIFFYCMFFFLKGGKTMIHTLISYIPLKEKESLSIIEKLKKTTLATVKWTFVIGLIQWTLAGIGFFIAGIPWAIFWWATMIVFSAIPMVWITIIWIPVCLYLLISGDMITPLILALYCGLLVGSIDNFLRPRLVWKDVWIHEILILMSTLWWLTLFGISGFIVGPTIIAFCIAMWDMYKKILKNLK